MKENKKYMKSWKYEMKKDLFISDFHFYMIVSLKTTKKKLIG